MDKPRISKAEFRRRVDSIRLNMDELGLDAFFVYGDEYRKENLRYVSNYWPMFERGALLIGKSAEPILLCAPEGQKVAEEMSAWPDIRLLPDFLCITVPDEIEYPLATYTDFATLAAELSSGNRKIKRLGVAGLDAMSHQLYETLQRSFNAELIDCNDILYKLRIRKSKDEIACLAEAARIADSAYRVLIETDFIGKTETEAAGIIEEAARREGAEQIVFSVFGSGKRTNTIIGRPSGKIIQDGDMIMCALAVQYEGYVATCEIPFAVGAIGDETRRVIDILMHAWASGLPHLEAGKPMKDFVIAVKEYFKEAGVTKYDVYPPLHGIGCAEAESPYPSENSGDVFKIGMTVNTDISLFGLPGGSNRIEEGYVLTEDGARSLSPFVHAYCSDWVNKN